MSLQPSNSEWSDSTIRGCLIDEFPGAWGSEPGFAGPNAHVLRSTNLDDDGHIDFATAAKRVVSDSDLTDRRLREGDILLEASGGGPGKPVGRVAHFQPPGLATYLCSNFFRALRPNPNKVNSRFLAWFLLFLHRQPSIWNFQQQTTGIINLKTKGYLDQRIPLPERAEQSRIAAVLDTVDEAIAKTEAVIAKLKQVRAGLLHDLLTRGLDENGQLRDPIAHPEQFQDSAIGRIPKGWEIRQIGALIAGFESGVSVDSVDIPASEGEIGVLKTSCLTGGIFNPLESKVVKPHERAHVNCRPRHDSIIISRMNTPQLVGESAYVESDFDHLFLPDRLWQTIKLSYDPTCIRWLSYVFQSPELRDKISAGATGTSGSMKNVSQMFVLGLDVRVPPRDEQQQIAETLGQQEEACHCEEAVLKKLRNLKSALMADLLTGRVRVPERLFGEEQAP